MSGLLIGRKGVDISQAQWSETPNNQFGKSLPPNVKAKMETKARKWKESLFFTRWQNNNNNLDGA